MTDTHKRIYNKKWNFENGSMKELVHGLHPYPAMMMPLIAREMFNEYGNGENTIFLDPYVGSGTTLVEAQLYGAQKAIGVDLNPLGILISKTKTEEFNLELLEENIIVYKDYIKIAPTAEAPNFSIRNSWFSEKTIASLARIKAYIAKLTDSRIIDFFKTCFSEVVRNSSETRNGEFKLYRMPQKALEKFDPDVISMFNDILDRNLNILKSVKYQRNTEITLLNEDTKNIDKHSELKECVDLIITSPPYGDSHTTVAYGQFSRLSNEWLGIEDAGKLDKKLLGGAKTRERLFGITELDEAIENIKNNDKDFNRNRCWEVVSFYNDYEKSIKAISYTVKKGGYVIFVVGNRRVRNVELPLDIITYKMFEKLGYEHIVTHVRDILNKRMPSKASPINEKGEQIPTMTKEYIVVMRKI